MLAVSNSWLLYSTVFLQSCI